MGPQKPRERPQVTLFQSISLNGLIGRPDGNGDFFTNVNWTAWIDLTLETGAMVWGRTSHDIFRRAAVPQLKGIHGYVLTSDRDYRTEEGWKVATSPQEAVELAHRDGVERMLVVGGQTTNTAFAKAGLIDRVVLDVESVLIGHGMPIFAPAHVDLQLDLKDVKRLTPTVIQLHYDVVGIRGAAHAHGARAPRATR